MAEINKNKKRQPQTTIVKVGANELGKLPPQATELEASVLSALMKDKDAYDSVADLLRPEVFYKDQHRLVYEAIHALACNEEPIDALTIVDKLKSQGKLEQVGGSAFIAELNGRVASAAHLRYHAQIVAQKATARDLIALAANIEEKGFDETQDISDLLTEASSGIFEIAQRSQKRSVVQVDSVVEEALERIAKAGQNNGSLAGIPSGFYELDKMTSGWQAPDLIIIAARPAMGKTAFVLSMAKNMAVDNHIPVAIFSLEMSSLQLVNRLIMNVCEIEGEKIKTGQLTKEDQKRLNTKINSLQSAPLFLDDTPSLSVFELRTKAQKIVKEHNVKVIIIDYLQLMNAQGMNFGSREQEVSIISRNLKALAKELDIPIIALSQLSRKVEDRSGLEGKTPQMSDLRESGAIEQDADLVCFIHRPEYYKFEADNAGKSLRGLAQIIIGKHRNGAVGSIWLQFRAKYAKFQNESDYMPEDEKQSQQPAPQQTISIQSSMNNNYSPVTDGQIIPPNNSTIDSLGESTEDPLS